MWQVVASNDGITKMGVDFKSTPAEAGIPVFKIYMMPD